jgi:hypothetical protein
MLPEMVQVRVLSDGAGYIDTTRVAHRQIPFPQLLDLVVAIAGLDPARIVTILRAGTATNAGYRYRWTAIQSTAAEIVPLLERFPKPDTARVFDAERCLLARIRAGVETIELPRDKASERQRGQSGSFWDVLIALAVARGPRYDNYSYRDGADLYVMDLTAADEALLRQAAPLLTNLRTAEQVGGLPLDRLILYVKR